MKKLTEDLNLKSVLNFRDLGGMPATGNNTIRRGMIFRSANPDRISRADIEKIDTLKIRTIIDLRSPLESKRKGKPIGHTEILSLPLDFQLKTRERLRPFLYKKNSEPEIAEISNALYLEILDASGPLFRQVLDVLMSEERSPVLIHCQAGKDRTGIMCGLILLALGAGRQSIIDDFMKSNEALLPFFKKLLLIRKILTFGFFPARRMLFAITVKQRNIESVLDRIKNHYGGIEGYLKKSGFDTSRLPELRKKYYED